MPTTTDTVTLALTSDDIAALRDADTITFHHGPADSRYVATCIRAHMRGGYSDAPRIWTAREQRVFNTADTTDRSRTVIPEKSTVRGYGAPITDSAVAFHSLYSSTAHWQTLVGFLRTGDTLRMEWIADNNNQNHEAARMHQDALYLHVLRGKRDMTFLLATSVGPHNTARMIRPDGM